jgi:4'-phosphopantetheinyl transferase
MKGLRQQLKFQVVARLVRVTGDLPGQIEVALNPTDRERAARFRFAEDRTRFLMGRALLGKLLGHYLGHEDALARLTYTEQGRPMLPDDPQVNFSISHARDWVAVALAVGTQVGIDVECRDRDLDFDALAERIFSEDDLAIFRALPAHESSAAFFRAWTGKEAILKARGVGLFGGLKEISIPWRGVETTATIIGGTDEEAGLAWQLCSLPLPEDYAGQVAWNDGAKTLDFREMTLEETP